MKQGLRSSALAVGPETEPRLLCPQLEPKSSCSLERLLLNVPPTFPRPHKSDLWGSTLVTVQARETQQLSVSCRGLHPKKRSIGYGRYQMSRFWSTCGLESWARCRRVKGQNPGGTLCTRRGCLSISTTPFFFIDLPEMQPARSAAQTKTRISLLSCSGNRLV